MYKSKKQHRSLVLLRASMLFVFMELPYFDAGATDASGDVTLS